MEENEIERKLQKLKLNGIKWNWKEPTNIYEKSMKENGIGRNPQK